MSKAPSLCDISVMLFFLVTKEEQSGGIVDPPQKLLTTNLVGYFGCQQAAGYPKTQFLFYAVKTLPTYPVTMSQSGVPPLCSSLLVTMR